MLGKKINEDACGCLYAAVEKKTGVRCAIKTISKKYISKR